MTRRYNTHIKAFSLIEVLIALTVFSFFITAYITSQGYNVLDSAKMREDILLSELCMGKINEIVANPPEFSSALTLRKESKSFEDYPTYEFQTSYKKFIIPDMSKLMPNEDEDNETAKINKLIYKNVKDAMEKMIWQLEVSVKNKESGQTFSLTTWLYNKDAEINLSF